MHRALGRGNCLSVQAGAGHLAGRMPSPLPFTGDSCRSEAIHLTARSAAETMAIH
jgi:hypothetical protein